jgi:hypothetical protein
MSTAHPLRISDQRLQRLCLWLALTVARFAAHVLGAVAPQMAARMLAGHSHAARNLLILRAIRCVGIKPPKVAFWRGSSPVEMRRIMSRGVGGPALRRALRGRTRADRANALCTVLADAERWIARIARRLKRGFTKLRCLPKPCRVRLRTDAPALLAERQSAASLNSS